MGEQDAGPQGVNDERNQPRTEQQSSIEESQRQEVQGPFPERIAKFKQKKRTKKRNKEKEKRQSYNQNNDKASEFNHDQNAEILSK